MRELVIATRESNLAVWQAEHVRTLLQQRDPKLQVTLLKVKTKGDKILDRALSEIGGKGLFVKEVEAHLLSGDAHLAVHSLKDLTADQPDGLVLAAYPERGDHRDAFVSNRYGSLAEMPAGSVVGTASLRRGSQLLYHYPELQVKTLRGNVETRLRKLDEGEYDAIILAAAGLQRLGLEERLTSCLPASHFVSAVGQGALVIQCREDQADVRAAVEALDHTPTRWCVEAERAFLATIEGSCRTPLGAHAVLEGSTLWFRGMLAAPDGSQYLEEQERFPVSAREARGQALAEKILARGGAAIMQEVLSDQ